MLRGQKSDKVDVTLRPEELEAMENVLPAKYVISPGCIVLAFMSCCRWPAPNSLCSLSTGTRKLEKRRSYGVRGRTSATWLQRFNFFLSFFFFNLTN